MWSAVSFDFGVPKLAVGQRGRKSPSAYAQSALGREYTLCWGAQPDPILPFTPSGSPPGQEDNRTAWPTTYNIRLDDKAELHGPEIPLREHSRGCTLSVPCQLTLTGDGGKGLGPSNKLLLIQDGQCRERNGIPPIDFGISGGRIFQNPCPKNPPTRKKM